MIKLAYTELKQRFLIWLFGEWIIPKDGATIIVSTVDDNFIVENVRSIKVERTWVHVHHPEGVLRVMRDSLTALAINPEVNTEDKKIGYIH